MERTTITSNEIIKELVRSPHGNLQEYVQVGQSGVKSDPEFYAHLIAWNHQKGQVRDSKVALPIINLSVGKVDSEFVDNAIAHILSLSPRHILQALRFSYQLRLPGYGRRLRSDIARWLLNLERNSRKWDRVAVQHRHTLKELYALTHTKPGNRAKNILFDNTFPANSVFATIQTMKLLPKEVIGEVIDKYRIPFLITTGALGKRLKEPEVLAAVLNRMSPNELINNMKRLEKLGVRSDPVLRVILDEKLQRTAKSKTNILKTSKAIENVTDDVLKKKLKTVQEKQITQSISVDGDWLVLVDASSSMSIGIETGRQVAALLARSIKGSVHVVFFNSEVRYFNMTGKTFEQITKLTRNIYPSGMTYLGNAMDYATVNKLIVNGVAIVSDGGENGYPKFPAAYQSYVKAMGVEPTIYLYHVGTRNQTLDVNMYHAELKMETFDLTGTVVDYYSLPNLVNTMRTNRYSLVDEILNTPLLTMDSIFKTDIIDTDTNTGDDTGTDTELEDMTNVVG